MSTTHTVIGEHDVVALLNPVEGWPAGAKGTVIIDRRPLPEVAVDFQQLGSSLL